MTTPNDPIRDALAAQSAAVVAVSRGDLAGAVLALTEAVAALIVAASRK